MGKALNVYNINKSIGRASSGVEYAQAYRYKLLKETEVKQKYIFTDFISQNLVEFTNNIGINKDEVIWIYSYLAGKKNSENTLSLDQFEKSLSDYEKNSTADFIEYRMNKKKLVLQVKVDEENHVKTVTHYLNGTKTLEAMYTDRLCYEIYFVNKKKHCIVFFNQKGQRSFTQFYDDNGAIAVTNFEQSKDIIYGEQKFLEKFFAELKIKKNDLVILDRNLGLATALLKHTHGATIAVVIHAEHFNAKRIYDDYLLWNNFYEYVFTNHQLIDYYITSTERQKQVLEQQMKKIHGEKFFSTIIAIPVGYVAQQEPVSKDQKFKLLTVSRLADEKHIDLIIEAVVQMKKKYPELILDIYGSGKNQQALTELIKANKAESFITLKGHQKMDSLYKEYGAYITASKSEGFGLSVLEAISNGLPVIGFDTEYGNKEFIKDGINGVLVPLQLKNNAEELTQGLDRFYSDVDYDTAVEESYKRAESFSFDRVKDKWETLFMQL